MTEILAVLVLTLFTIPYWVENRKIRKLMKGGMRND